MTRFSSGCSNRLVDVCILVWEGATYSYTLKNGWMWLGLVECVNRRMGMDGCWQMWVGINGCGWVRIGIGGCQWAFVGMYGWESVGALYSELV